MAKNFRGIGVEDRELCRFIIVEVTRELGVEVFAAPPRPYFGGPSYLEERLSIALARDA